MLPVKRGGGSEGLGRPLRAQRGRARPAGAAMGAPLPAPRERQTPRHLRALGLGQGAALGQHRGLGWEGQCAGGRWLQPPEPPVEVLRGALCGDRRAGSPLQAPPAAGHGGTSEGAGVEKAGRGCRRDSGCWLAGGISAMNWLGSAFGRSQRIDCWAVQRVHVDPEP